jgi:hypothetical protein
MVRSPIPERRAFFTPTKFRLVLLQVQRMKLVLAAELYHARPAALTPFPFPLRLDFGGRSSQNSTLQNNLAVKFSDHSWRGKGKAEI